MLLLVLLVDGLLLVFVVAGAEVWVTTDVAGWVGCDTTTDDDGDDGVDAVAAELEVEAAAEEDVDEADLLALGFGAAASDGIAPVVESAVTEADWLEPVTGVAGEPLGAEPEEVVDFVAMPIASAIANGITTATASNHQRGRAPEPERTAPLCTAALLSMALAPSSHG